MISIREIYKIGKGPSSSHTIGPERAATVYREAHPDAAGYRVVLYGSLSKTGKGHGTDRVLRQVLSPVPTEIVFSEEMPADVNHPNTMDFFTVEDGKPENRMRAVSVGGGDVVMEGQEHREPPEVYPENSFAEIQQFCRFRGVTLSEYVELCEGEEIWTFLSEIWQTMKKSVQEGLHAQGILPGGLRVERKAQHLFEQKEPGESPQIAQSRIISAYAFAVSEQNADCGTIVTAPTCGSCGVLPAVLLYMQETHKYPDVKILPALAVAGLIGNLVKKNASISGAECGCQAEIGTACAMAAGALCELMGMEMDNIQYAAEIALEHNLGLTCDPICGLVQVPCIERNAVAAMQAMDCMNLSNFLADTQRITLDMVIRTMYETGVSMNRRFRETAEGGLAKMFSHEGMITHRKGCLL